MGKIPTCFTQHIGKTKRDAEGQETERPSKKRKVDPETRKTARSPKQTVKSIEERSQEKTGQKIGALIGRKRKERRAGKKA